MNERKIVVATILSGVVGIPQIRHELVEISPPGSGEPSSHAMQQARGGLLPQEKLEEMRALQAAQRASLISKKIS